MGSLHEFFGEREFVVVSFCWEEAWCRVLVVFGFKEHALLWESCALRKALITPRPNVAAPRFMASLHVDGNGLPRHPSDLALTVTPVTIRMLQNAELESGSSGSDSRGGTWVFRIGAHRLSMLQLVACVERIEARSIVSAFTLNDGSGRISATHSDTWSPA